MTSPKTRLSGVPLALVLAFLTSLRTSAVEATPVCRFGKLTQQAVETHSIDYSKEPEVVERVIRPQWDPGRFTDPVHHDPDNFIYIIRVGPSGDRWSMLDDVRRNASISASVIAKRPNGKEFLGKFPGSGSGTAFILKIPASSIILSKPADTGRMGNSRSAAPTKEGMENALRYYGLYTPDALINASIEQEQERKIPEGEHYNEILFVGSKQVEIIGIAEFGNAHAEALKKSTALGGIPIVKIK